jgi:hypothetical protein
MTDVDRIVQEHIVDTPAKEEQKAFTSSGQRRINLIWEITQALVALSVTGATLHVASVLSLSGNDKMAAFLLLSNAFFLVIGFYFGRNNHQRVGGVGGVDVGR